MSNNENRKEAPLYKKFVGVGIGLALVSFLIYIYKTHGVSIPLFGPQTTEGKAIIYWDLWKMFKKKVKKRKK